MPGSGCMADDDDEDPTILREAISDSWRRSSRRGRRSDGRPRWPRSSPTRRETHDRYAEHPLARARAADPRVPVRDRRPGGLPDRRQRRRRHADDDRGPAPRAAARRRRHELRRGHAVERGRRGHERDRHGARRRPRGPGLRARALQRPRAALDVQRVPDPRPGHGRGDRRDRPHGRPVHRPPAQPRRRHRDRPRRRGQPAARAAGARRPPARPLRRPRVARPLRARHAVRPHDRRRPARLEGPGPARDPARRRRAHAARPASPAVAEPVSPTLEAFVVHAVESKRVSRASRARWSSSPSSAATARSCRSRTRSPTCARAWPRSSRCCARTRTG